ncbi:7SK snRNA methylphosphate capping enzyme-like [Homarus americanus]|uniref:RNA methyltransferase n=1 Tax=Homarus americanus TaxID=6706 RepID=A0A8J5JV23_HOMAM|nr:7SK snRNA methylphosphate capping enzyme-like [Homarus americanus]KAG7164580.1 7SK snRNA methylphosphate capping enzyme-like [Homarus americanus]
MSSELGVERPRTLALPESQVERRVHFSDVDGSRLVSGRQSQVSTTPSPRKLRPVPDFRPKRKRSISFSSAGEFRFGNKRRKRGRVLPSKFLLGGNITDPLNLGSLDKEEIAPSGVLESTGSAVSKRSDAVRVIIAPNINDPLNLDASSDNEDLQKQIRRRRRNRKRKRRLSEPSGSTADSMILHGIGEVDTEETPTLETNSLTNTELARQISLDAMKPLTVNTDLSTPQGAIDGRKEGPVTPTGTKPSTSGIQRPVFKKQRSKSENKIVSPVIPQPGGERKRHPSHSRHYAEKPHLSQQNLQPPKKFNPKNELFQYGNYNKYYGYRNPDQTPDVRLEYLKREWFEGKEVLDIGCNIGHVTLTVARDYNPKRVVGIDIDKKLVSIAEKNIKHYLRKGDTQEANFPKSMRLLYGPLKPPVRADGSRTFPHNVKFVHANYVLESDELLETVRPEFDMILCLSITKWVHLNWGDSGLKRFFRRVFHNLKPGGRFILEPQGWPSYNKRRKLTKRIFENYKNIRLFPDKFNDFLLHEVGFGTSEKTTTPHHASRGFQRPIIIYTKAGGSSKSSPAEESKSKDMSSKKKSEENQSIKPDEQCERRNAQVKEVSISYTVETSEDNVFVQETDQNKKSREKTLPVITSLVKEAPAQVTGNSDQHNLEIKTLSKQMEKQCKHLEQNTKVSEPTVKVPDCRGLEDTEDKETSERWKDSGIGNEDKHICDTRIIRESEVSSCLTHSSNDTQSVTRICELPYSSVSKVKDKNKVTDYSEIPPVVHSTNNCKSYVSCYKVSDAALTKELDKTVNSESTDGSEKRRTISSASTVTEKDYMKGEDTEDTGRPKSDDKLCNAIISSKCYDSPGAAALKDSENKGRESCSAISVEQSVTVIPQISSLHRNKLELDKLNASALSPLKRQCTNTDEEDAEKHEPHKRPRLEDM